LQDVLPPKVLVLQQETTLLRIQEVVEAAQHRLKTSSIRTQSGRNLELSKRLESLRSHDDKQRERDGF
jgi:hypothetical protein